MRRTCASTLPVAALGVALVLAAAASPTQGAAQERPGGEVAGQEDTGTDRSVWSIIAGERVDRRRFTAAMLALHPFEPQFPEADWTWGVAFSWSQWFFSTFINSYDERGFIAGLERSWVHGRAGPAALGLGYRVGVVTGYDERLISWARHTPVLPFAGVLAWTDVGPLGIDVYYVYRAITFETSIRF